MQIVFVHIPKTAGTAVREALFRARPDAANLCDYGPDHPATSELVKQLLYSPGSGPSQLRAVLAPTPAWTLAGHFKAKTFGRLFGPGRLMTVLRDPVERVVSNWRHYLRRRQFEGSAVEFARRPEIRNVQTRFTRPFALGEWLFVARQDRLDQDMDALSERLGVRLKLERLNQAPDGAADISPPERRQIEALNLQDMELFESCRPEGPLHARRQAKVQA